MTDPNDLAWFDEILSMSLAYDPFHAFYVLNTYICRNRFYSFFLFVAGVICCCFCMLVVVTLFHFTAGLSVVEYVSVTYWRKKIATLAQVAKGSPQKPHTVRKHYGIEDTTSCHTEGHQRSAYIY